MTFETKYRLGKEYNLDSDLKPELSSFLMDGKLDKNENLILNDIFEYNENRDKEKEIIRLLTREKLESLKNIPGVRKYIVKRINRILSFDYNGGYENSSYFLEKKDRLLVKNAKQQRLDEVMTSRPNNNISRNKEYIREKDLLPQKLLSEYNELVDSNKVAGMSSRYKRVYEKSSERISKFETPPGTKELLKKYSAIDLKDVLSDRSLRYLKTKYLIKNNWNKIKTLMLGGVVRALKNANHKFKGKIDVTKIPLIINVPLARKRGSRYENASLSFIHNPKIGKIDIELFSYGFRREKNADGVRGVIWSRTPKSHSHSLGSHLLNLKNGTYRPGRKIQGSKRSFKYYEYGLEKGVNDNVYGRAMRLHGVSPKRSSFINRGITSSPTIASRGCTIYPNEKPGKILRENRGKKYAIMEMTYPVL